MVLSCLPSLKHPRREAHQGREEGPCFGEGNGNPRQYSCLENCVDKGAWRATVHGVTKSQTQLKTITLSVVLSHLPSLKHLGRETHQGREKGPCLSCLHCSSCAHVPSPLQTRLSIGYVLAPTLRFGGCTLVAKDAMDTTGPLFRELRVYAAAA